MNHIPSKSYSRFKKIQKMLLREFLQNLRKNEEISKVDKEKSAEKTRFVYENGTES